jgi:ATP-binding cassette subfamily B (MDR/TAP) protein 1
MFSYSFAVFFLTLMQTLYAGTICFNILLGAIKPVSKVTQEEIAQACHNANILEFINLLPELVMPWLFVCPAINENCYQCSSFDTEVGGKGSQLSGGQKHMSNVLQPLRVTLTGCFRTHCYCLFPPLKSQSTSVG